MKLPIEEAKRLIRINSVSAHGNEELVNHLSSLLIERQLKPILQQVTHSIEGVSKRQFNIIAILGDPLVDKKTKKGLLLHTGLDTVSPGILENWTETEKDPLNGTVRDGKIYGLGASSKIDILCKLQALERFRERKLRMPVYIVGTCGGELGMFGSKYLIKSLALNPRYVVVGEPTGLKIVHAHKSMAVFKISIDYQLIERDARGFNRRIDMVSYGKLAHGATPDRGVNAISQAIDFLERAAQSGFEIRFTQIEGGETKNTVPDHTRIEFYLTSHQFEDFKRFFRDFVRMEGHERSFRAELGGLGETGVRFLPDALYPCLTDVHGFFKVITTELARTRDNEFDPPSVTVNFSQVCQRATGLDLYFDVRMMPDEDAGQVESKILEGIRSIAGRYPGLNVVAKRERGNPGLNQPKNSEFHKICSLALESAGIVPELAKKAVATEAALYAQAGFDVVIWGPGAPSGNSHGPNEFNDLAQMEQAIEFYTRLIERVCT